MPLSSLVKVDTSQGPQPLDRPPGPVPGHHHLVQPVARRVSLGEATAAVEQARADARRPGHACRALPGHRPGLPGLYSRTSLILILAALLSVYVILGVLYESYIHPLTILSTLPSAGLGATAGPPAGGSRPRRDRHHRHHPPDRHREEERHHDRRCGAQARARGATWTRGGRAARLAPAACGPILDDHGLHLPGRPADDPDETAPARSSATRWAGRSWAACSSPRS